MSPLLKAAPAAPASPWLGGKSRLAGEIISRIEAVPHKTYVEPFMGMGGIFLRRPFRASVEVANDLSGDISNFFRILQRHHAAFLEDMRWRIGSREEFERLRDMPPDCLTDIERATRFLYLQLLRYGGKPNGVFRVDPRASCRFNFEKLAPVLKDIHARFSGVVVERLPYADVIQRYDNKRTLFYLDPPYFGCENVYGKGMFARPDFAAIADQLARIKGKFILSINDKPEMREAFKGFCIDTVKVRYSINDRDTPSASELIISNV